MEIDLVGLAALLGRINPRAWDAIIPHGHRDPMAIAQASRAALRGFDPQPDPPGRWFRILRASAEVAHEIAMAAVAAEAAGSEGASRIVARAVDDWCGTKPQDLPIPWPRSWPFPWAVGYGGPDMYPGPDTYPGPDDTYPGPDVYPGHGWAVSASRLVGALSLASVASRLTQGEARDALANGAEQLARAALSG